MTEVRVDFDKLDDDDPELAERLRDYLILQKKLAPFTFIRVPLGSYQQLEIAPAEADLSEFQVKVSSVEEGFKRTEVRLNLDRGGLRAFSEAGHWILTGGEALDSYLRRLAQVEYAEVVER